jgi:hypothetical protein
MPLQNRVTPFGDIVAIPQRGLFTGNRGIIHDPATRTLLKRRWASKAWLVCLCEFKGRRRAVMSGRSWTELFFLDEAVALAAGHRPCFFWRRQAAEAFRDAWARGRAARLPRASEMDSVLHAERLDHGRKRLHGLPGGAEELPDGTVVAAAGAAYTLAHGRAFRWTERGYEGAVEIPRGTVLLTPPSTLAALRTGYRPVLHPSVASTECCFDAAGNP